ncbi:FecR family protein [Larkinella soli]|uniref:FecR family protein n=1 Tax=Larkinella soli TaxID=1770527 RepID=UPI000FFC7146|nr:FecR domain-containing protein [Larkinella soli]
MGERYPSPDLLEKYLSGRCTPDEARQVEAWYDSFENRPDLSQTHPETRNPAYSRQLLHQIRQRIESIEQRPMGPVSPRPWWRRGGWMVYVGGVAALLVLAVGFWQANRNGKAPAVARAKASEWIVLRNDGKAIVRYELTDGSVVWLSPSTRLRYPRRFAARLRAVDLEGEAFFEVRRDASRPFVIRSGKLKTEVLGTTFNVRAYRQSPRFEVSVVTGKVAVSVSDRKKVLLTARQQAVFNQKAESLAKTVLPRRARPQVWEPATIAFEWASLGQVAGALEETFGVQIQFANPALRNCRLRADFTNMRLPVILNLLCKTTGSTYSLDGSLIELNGPGCP